MFLPGKIFQKECNIVTKISNSFGQPIRGLNIVYTGNGKGKTTAAMGAVLRAYGHDLSTGVIQFIKSPELTYGEAAAAVKLKIPFQSLGDGFVIHRSDKAAARDIAISAWEEAQLWICSGEFDLIILDEITYLFYLKWLEVDDFIAWIRQNKPSTLHLVMTGRNAPDELIEFADLVTEMREIKHPFRSQGIPAQLGVDF